MQAIPENISKNRVQATLLLNLLTVLAGVALAAWIASSVFGYSTDERWTLVWGLYWVLAVVLLPVSWYRARARRGSLLLDLGPEPQRRWLWFLAAWFLLMPLGGTLVRFDQLFPYGSWAVGATGAIFMAAAARSRRQFREGGIWAMGNLTPWSRIEGYDVRFEEMRFRIRQRFLWDGFVALRVDSEDQEEAKRIVDARLGS